MGKRLLWALSALAACAFAHDSSITTPSKALLPRATSTNSACALASSAAHSYLANEETATTAHIPAELAYNCLKSIPNYKEPAVSLLNSLRTYIEFQSTKEYLRDPPTGYLLPAVDIDAGLDGIQQKLQAGGYDSEYDFQGEIVSLLLSAHDGHLDWHGDVHGAFTYLRLGGGLYSVSSDGVEPPLVYVAADLIVSDPDTDMRRAVTGYRPSPVQSINGIDVMDFLLTQSLNRRSQDPDALWNMMFRSLLSVHASFEFPLFYPGPETNITFANGTTKTYENVAITNVDLAGINTGEEAYSMFCSGVEVLESLSATASVAPTASSSILTTTSDITTPTEAPTSSPTISGFPYPVIKHSAGSVAGYYLNDTGFTDVAILQILEFGSQTDDSAEYEREFQSAVEKFLAASVRTGKRKLIIDLRGNPGGFIDLGTDTFAQLFPSLTLNSKSNMRDHLGFWILGNAASDNITAAGRTANTTDELVSERFYTPLAYQTVVTENHTDFPDFQTYYGPNFMYDGMWTSFFQNNYTEPNASDFAGTGIIITGTNDRTGYRQPYASQDIVVLTDGYCASTCSVFTEYLKTYAHVQFIAIGGRPQTGPMQAIGGVKGAQAFTYSLIASWTDLFNDPSNHYIGEANGTMWENFTYEPLLREFGFSGGSVNGRNHFRMDDETNTPLQFVYEAADCRMWWTREMLYDPVFLWKRVATMAFQERKGTQFNSKYCVANSTGHPTSISGGWKTGLGPQTPPEIAKATIKGWKLTGTPLQAAKAGTSLAGSGSGSGLGSDSTTGLGDAHVVVENNAVADTTDTDSEDLASFKQYCSSYTGDAWFVKLMCGALQ
ncbi:hypothetical protein A1O7_07085 [Cladophialophora yegresii CBS 114405]|uniref:Uncharacterized protein n=1 Tax=Cladophialophora yegresii CBS 114405 TaxID=1182544 RepID=W9VWY3_9EURO|nr:uncharacterized protein A1O7_07085 [Cladophialophora yegresii CBS 114405]EXJ56741.1 hypothetical protein A1O7_07085 [Cladophialophora yegresii CBS 114405]